MSFKYDRKINQIEQLLKPLSFLKQRFIDLKRNDGIFFFNFQTNFTLFLFSNMTTCPDQRTVNFTIFPEGLEERVEIEVEHVCDCDCQLEPEAVINSK